MQSDHLRFALYRGWCRHYNRSSCSFTATLKSAVFTIPFDVPVICIATFPVITCVIGAEVDPSVLASPRYCAVITCTPTGKFVVRNDTIPAFTFAAFPNADPLSNTSTLNVTGVPNPAFRIDEVTVVVVATCPALPPPPHPNTTLTMPTTNPPW